MPVPNERHREGHGRDQHGRAFTVISQSDSRGRAEEQHPGAQESVHRDSDEGRAERAGNEGGHGCDQDVPGEHGNHVGGAADLPVDEDHAGHRGDGGGHCADGDVQRRTAGGAKTLTRATTRTTVGAGAGVLAAGQRRRMIAADPTRGPLRRTAGTLLTPVSLVTGGLRGAAFGPQDAQRRAWKTMNRGQINAVKAANAAQASGGSKKKTPSPAGTSGTTPNPPGSTARTPVPDITPERPPHRTAPATTGQPPPPAQNYDTVSI